MIYNQRMRELREDHDYKQETVALFLKITKQQYSLYETGKRKLPIDHLLKLCELYTVSADYILGLPQGLSYPKR